MTYDDCEAFEAQQAEERASRLYARFQEVKLGVSRLPEDDLRGRLEARLEAVASRLRVMEEALMERETLRVSPLVRELSEIRRALETNRTEAS